MTTRTEVDYVVVLANLPRTHRFAYPTEARAREAIAGAQAAGRWKHAELYRRTVVGTEDPEGFSLIVGEPAVDWGPEALVRIDL